MVRLASLFMAIAVLAAAWPPRSSAEPMKGSRGSAARPDVVAVEGPVLVSGRAIDTEAGAALETEWGTLWIEGLDRWPGDVLGGTLELKGIVDARRGHRVAYASWVELREDADERPRAGYIEGDWSESKARRIVEAIDADWRTTDPPRPITVEASQPFDVSGIPKRFIQISQAGESCRHCAGRIGVVIFSQTADGWSVEERQRDWLEVGAHGVAPRAVVVRLGPEAYGAAFGWSRAVMAATDFEHNLLVVELAAGGYRTALRDRWYASDAATLPGEIVTTPHGESARYDVAFGSRRYRYGAGGYRSSGGVGETVSILAAPLHEVMTRDLPWEFSHDERREGAATVYAFESVKPLRDRTYLRFRVTVTQYDRPEAAEDAFDAMRAEADPDTGLSYAWDLVLLERAAVVHLWAPCLFSRQSFETLERNLASALERPASRSLRCACGRGCSSGAAVISRE